MERNSLLKNKKQRMIIGVTIGLFIIFIFGFFLGTRYEKGKVQTTVSAATQTTAPTAYATQNLNKNYQFPIKDSNGKVLTNIDYTIQDAQLMNQIIVNGQPYNAVKGKTFLILDLKLTNSFDQDIQLPTRDYVRLSVNGSKELLAADIHNDPVQVQAISTKYTRIGFPIDSDFKTLTLQVGQIDGTKDTIKLDHLKK